MSVELNSQPTTHHDRKDCTHPRVKHQHGTEQAYISDRCRCRPCRDAHAQRAAWRRRQYAYGRDIAHLVPAIGSARRMEALLCLGWSFAALAARCDIRPEVLRRARQQPRIISTKAEVIARLYDQLWDQRPPERTKGERISASRTRSLAADRGYLPPLAYDDDTIDDPASSPIYNPGRDDPDDALDEVAVERLMAGTLRLPGWTHSPERIEAVHQLHALGFTDRQAGERVGLSRDSVLAIRLRHQRKEAA